MEKRLEELLRYALKEGASDIHITDRKGDVVIEMRIASLMKRVKSQAEDKKLLYYLRYLSNLDVGTLTLPETGQFEMLVDVNYLSLRFATINTLNSASGVIRILNKNLNCNGSKLSLFPSQNQKFKSLLEKKNGLILFTGPTGSGKTTSLYSLLKTVEHKKIYTLEDPIEVYQEEYMQLEINDALAFDFDEGLRQILRHDPDILMIGEIRDEKAAGVALRAANTGHLVLSSLHASSSSRALSRLNDLKISDKQLLENLEAISYQNLYSHKNKKIVLYEIMDHDEIKYYFAHGHNSPGFLSVEKQYELISQSYSLL